MWLQSVDPVVCCAQLVTGDAATDTFRLKLLQYRARCYLLMHAAKACKREIKNLITAGGPVSGEGGGKTERDIHTYIQCSVVMNNYSFGISLHHNLRPTETVFARLFLTLFRENRERKSLLCNWQRYLFFTQTGVCLSLSLLVRNKSKQFSNLGNGRKQYWAWRFELSHETQLQYIYTSFNGRTGQSCLIKCKPSSSERKNILQPTTAETWH